MPLKNEEIILLGASEVKCSWLKTESYGREAYFKTKLNVNIENGLGLILGSRILRETILIAKDFKN